MKRATLWPIGLAGVLTLTVAGNVALYLVARDDPSFAIEPDYYAKAIAWDSTIAQARRNDTLGWRLTPTLEEFGRDGARLHVTLTDSTGRRIPDAVVNVSAMYVARAGHVLASTLERDDDGYSTRLAVHDGGQWELRFDVTRGSDRFTAISRVEAMRAPDS